MSRVSRIEILLADKYGDLNNVIPVLVTKLGQAETAKRLNVTQRWVSRWLARNGFKQVWKKESEVK